MANREMKSYRDLVVWQKSIQLVEEIYKLTRVFPKEESYGLTAQMRRAAVSIPSNLAEGYSRNHRREYIQFVRIAFGSGAELETQIEIAIRLGYIDTAASKKTTSLLTEVMKMLNKLSSSLNPKP